jgi:hypothetical protein
MATILRHPCLSAIKNRGDNFDLREGISDF